MQLLAVGCHVGVLGCVFGRNLRMNSEMSLDADIEAVDFPIGWPFFFFGRPRICARWTSARACVCPLAEYQARNSVLHHRYTCCFAHPAFPPDF